MGDVTTSKNKMHTSTPAPNRIGSNKKLFDVSPLKPIPVNGLSKLKTMDLVTEAIKAVGVPRKGASVPAIKKWITANSESSARNQNALLKKALEKGIESGTIVRPSHSKDCHGLTGWFSLAKSPQKGKTSKISEKESKTKENTKEQKITKDVKEIAKKGNKKGVKDSQKEAIEGESDISPSKVKNQESSKEISNKSTKKNVRELPRTVPKKGLKTKNIPLSKEKNKFVFSETDSDKENIENKQEMKPLAPKNAKTHKTTKQEKEIKTESKTKNAVGKEKGTESKRKEENELNDDTAKKPNTDRAQLKETVRNFNAKLRKVNSKKNIPENNEEELIQEDKSDTEIDKRSKRLKSIKSYASDSELELSRMVPENKKTRVIRKTLAKKIKATSETTVKSMESDINNTRSVKPPSASKLRKPKKNEG